MVDRIKRDERTYEKLLDIAENRRNLEINLLWQRAWLFWGFTVAGFAAYAYFFAIPNYEEALLVAGFGFLSSVIWTLVNRGSKFWQEYWEDQIDLVKSEAVKSGNANYVFFDKAGKYEKEKLRNKGFWGGVRFSPSQLIIALSDYVTASWLFIIFAQSVVVICGLPEKGIIGIVGMAVIIITIIYAIVVFDRTKNHVE